jgi:hypothetical protein
MILNRIETVALAMIYLLKLGSKANGSSIAVVADKLVEVEEQAGKNFPGLLGKKLWNAMASGRNVLVFPTLWLYFQSFPEERCSLKGLFCLS